MKHYLLKKISKSDQEQKPTKKLLPSKFAENFQGELAKVRRRDYGGANRGGEAYIDRLGHYVWEDDR